MYETLIVYKPLYTSYSQASADQVFEQRQVGEGYFLVRESRTKDETFILSLFQREGIFNYRISREGDGRFALVDTTGISPVPKSVNSCQTLNALINHHHHFCVGFYQSSCKWA